MLKAKKIGIGLAVAAVWLALWQGIHAAVGLDMLLPSPWQVAVELSRMVVTGSFWLTIAWTVVRVVVGFVVGYGLGAVLAVLSYRFRLVDRFLSPVIYVVKSTPVASFIILALCWMGTETVPSFICLLMVLPIVFGNVLTGLKAVDRDLLEMSRGYGFSFGKRLRSIYLPSVRPYLTSASGTGLGLSWKAGIAAEVICRSRVSIGNEIFESKYYLEITRMFAWTVVVVLLSVLFDRLLKLASRRLARRAPQGGEAA